MQYQKVIKSSLPRWYNYLVLGSVPLVRKISRLTVFTGRDHMSILIRMNSALIMASSSPRSTDAEINELVRYSSFDIPEKYLDIIRESTELEICVDKKKYFRLWGAKGCIELNDAYHIQKYIPDSLAIGDDECSNAVIYANGEKGPGLYIVPFNDLEADSMIYIAGSLRDFLVDGVGLDVFNCVV